MKKILCTLIIILALSLPAMAQDIAPHVTVYGTAITEVTPDEMFWSLRVANKGPGIEELAGQHSDIVRSVLTFVKKAGVEKDDTQTSMMQFGENWEHKNGRRVQKGYVASSQITFKLTDFSKYQHLWTGLAKIKDMSIQNISYGYSKREKAQGKARVDALLIAKEKAFTMAKTLDVKLGDPLVIEDDPSFAEPRRSKMMMAEAAPMRGGSSGGGGYALGKIEVMSRVKVVYELDR
jgi:uncharacterized protein YggE